MASIRKEILLESSAENVWAAVRDVGLDEVGMWLTARVVDVVSGTERRYTPAPARDRRRAVDAALWIDATRTRPSISRRWRARPG